MEQKVKIAHKREDTNDVQTIYEHSVKTAELARSFSIPELRKIIYNTALLHDIGKYQPSFQERIGRKNIHVDHSTCGAIEAKKLFGNGPSSLIAQYCIAGHHSGIPNGGTSADTKDDTSFYGRLKREPDLEDYSDYKAEITAEKPDVRALAVFWEADIKELLEIPI